MGSGWSADYGDWDSWLVNASWVSKTENRYHPYLHPGLRYVSRLTYQFCPDLTVQPSGADLDFHAAFGSLTRRYQISGSHVVAETALEVPRTEVSVPNIEHFNTFLDRISSESRITIPLVPAAQ